MIEAVAAGIVIVINGSAAVILAATVHYLRRH